MCSRILTCLFIIYYFFSAIYGGSVIAQLASRGLFFRNYETIQDKRTGLELFAEEPLVLNRKLNLEFDIRFNQKAHSYFGYILRLIGNDQYNIDLVCRDFSPKFKNISIVIGDKEYPISISPEMAYSYQWKKVQIMLDLEQDQLEFSFNGQKYRYPLHLPDNLAVTVNFGMTRQSGFASTDVPPIGIRQLKVTNDTYNYYWPLNERSGEIALDQYHQAQAKVSNPLWGVALSENWSELIALQVHSNSSLCFDPVHEIVYIVGNDKLLAFSSLEGTLKEIPYADGPLKLLKGNQSIFISGGGTGEGKIINLFPDQRLASTFDFKTRRWSKSYMSGETTAYWHFNKVYWPEDSSIYLFGGYGYFAYKNAIQQVVLHNSNYRQLAAANDVFSPRYLAAAGASQRGIYLMGGYGSLNGKQEVNPRNYNDLLLLDMTTKKMKKLGDIDFQHPGYVLSNSLIVDEKDSLIYGLVHEKNVFNTQLQLFRCDMNAKELQMIGKGIPYSFHDIRSYSDLYLSRRAQKLLTATLFDRGNHAQFKLYGLDYPPLLHPSGQQNTVGSSRTLFWGLVVLGLCLFGTGLYGYVRKNRRDTAPPAEVEDPDVSLGIPERPIFLSSPNNRQLKEGEYQLHLFGQFELSTAAGEPVSHLLTPILRQIFLIIYLSKVLDNKSVRSDSLYGYLWPNKDVKSARNNLLVNIGKLKHILQELKFAELTHTEGNWQLHLMEDRLRCDLQDFIFLSRQEKLPLNEVMRGMIDLHLRGKILEDWDTLWTDSYKSMVNLTMDDIFCRYMQTISNRGMKPELNLIASFCKVMPFHEEAMQYYCCILSRGGQHEEAHRFYSRFAQEYQIMYGEKYPLSLSAVLSEVTSGSN